MPKLSLVREEPSDRTALIEARRALELARADLDTRHKAVDSIRGRVRAIEQEIIAADQQVVEAQAEHTAAISAAAIAGTAVPAGRVRTAKAVVEDRRDERAATVAALSDLRAQIPDTELHVRQCEAAVDTEISKLLRPIALDLIADMRRLAGELAQVRANLFALLDGDQVPPADTRDYRVKRQRVTDLVRAEFEAGQGEPRAAAATDWKAVREQLRHDPNAALPAI